LTGIIRRADPESIHLSKAELLQISAYLETANKDLRTNGQEG